MFATWTADSRDRPQAAHPAAERAQDREVVTRSATLDPHSTDARSSGQVRQR